MTQTGLSPAVMQMSEEQMDGLLKGRQCVLLLDNTLSMRTPDVQGGDRFSAQREVASFIVSVMDEIDPDTGIDVVIFGTDDIHFTKMLHTGVTAGAIADVLPESPSYMETKTAYALDGVFQHLQRQYAGKPFIVVVMTDGDAQDRERLVMVLKNAAKSFGGETGAVAFWQIGYDSGATKLLNYLDEGLGEVDICDTVSFDTVMANFSKAGIKRLLVNAIID